MIHQTYRRLDEPPTLGPFTILQWLLLILLGGAVVGLHSATHLGMQATLCVATFALGVPGAVMYLSETGRPSYFRLIRDAVRWLLSPRILTVGHPHVHRAFTVAAPTEKDLLDELETTPSAKELTR